MTGHTVTKIQIAAVPPTSRRGVSALTSLFLGLQDLAFEALAELRYGLDRLTQATQYDDQETAIEQAVFSDMQACATSGCRCCGRHLPRLLRADRYDHQERFDGHAVASLRLIDGAAYVRASSTQIEAGRALVLAGYRRESGSGPEGAA